MAIRGGRSMALVELIVIVAFCVYTIKKCKDLEDRVLSLEFHCFATVKEYPEFNDEVENAE